MLSLNRTNRPNRRKLTLMRTSLTLRGRCFRHNSAVKGNLWLGAGIAVVPAALPSPSCPVRNSTEVPSQFCSVRPDPSLRAPTIPKRSRQPAHLLLPFLRRSCRDECGKHVLDLIRPCKLGVVDMIPNY